MEYKGLVGTVADAVDAELARARCDEALAMVSYVALMADVEMPDGDEAGGEPEGAGDGV